MQKHWGIFLVMLKKVGIFEVGIFLGVKYEPLSDPPSLKYVSGAPGISAMTISLRVIHIEILLHKI